MTRQRNKPLVKELRLIKIHSICSRKYKIIYKFIVDYFLVWWNRWRGDPLGTPLIDWTQLYRIDLKYHESIFHLHESILPHKALISYSICHFIISFILIPGCLCCLFRCLWRPYLVLIVNPQYLHLYILFKCFASIWRVRSFRLQACWPHPLHQYVPMLFRVI